MSTDALKPDAIDPSVGVSSSPSLASSAVSDGSDASPPTLATLNNYKLRWEQFLVQAEPSQEAKHNTSAALQALLKHKTSMTMELLRDSGIGKVLNKLRKKGQSRRQYQDKESQRSGRILSLHSLTPPCFLFAFPLQSPVMTLPWPVNCSILGSQPPPLLPYQHP